MSEFDQEEHIDEGEIDALGIKKKADADLIHGDDEAEEHTDEVVGEESKEDSEEDSEHGYFGNDKEFEEAILNPYGDRTDY